MEIKNSCCPCTLYNKIKFDCHATKFKPYCSDVVVAEAWTVAEGVAGAMNIGYSLIEVECDSFGVMYMVNSGKEYFFSEVGAFVDDIRRLLTTVSAQVGFVSRECNKLACALSNFALRSCCSEVWHSNFPSWISAVEYVRGILLFLCSLIGFY